jgi:hypothetical protein
MQSPPRAPAYIFGRTAAFATAALIACSNGSTDLSFHTILIAPITGPIYGPDLWRAADSAAPASWSVPTQGWDTLVPGKQLCIHVPNTVRTVLVSDSQSGATLGIPRSWVGYLRLSSLPSSWTAGDSGFALRDSVGKIVFRPAAPCQ